MAIRDKLRSAASPYLEPGEEIEQVFIAHAGARPWAMLGFLFGLVGLVAVYAIKPLIIAVTDRSIVVLQGSRFRSAKAKALLARLPRQTRLGPATAKMWSKLNVAGQRMWVARQFAVDVTQADAPLLNPPPPAAPAPPVDSAPPVAAGEPTAGTWGWSAPAPPTDLPPAAAPPPMAPPAPAVGVQTGRWPLDTGLSRTGQWVLGIAGLVVTVLIVAGAVGASNENDARQRVKDYIAGSGRHSFFAADGRFRAEFPGAPTRNTQTEQVAGYTLNTVLYQRDVGLDSSFIVTYVDFPFAPPDPTGALNGAANGVAVASKGEVLTATPTTYAGRQALEAVISIRLRGGTTGTHFAKTLLVIDGVRLYSVSVFDKVNPPGGYDGFVKSFEIVPG